MRKLIFRNFQSPGDIVMLTAAVRDLHRQYPNTFQTDVRTPCPDLWRNNPYLTPLDDDDPLVEQIECHYPLVQSSNIQPWHFIHGFIDYLNDRLGIAIRPSLFKGDIHLESSEREEKSQVEHILGAAVPFWIVVAGGKRDFTIKWWLHDRFQKVVDHYIGKILFVQVGENGHEHRQLRSVLDLRGKTSLRQLIKLIHHAEGILCPVTLHMHLAAAVEVRSGLPKNRACVVVAGGREPSHWESYPNHQLIHTNGALWCCDNGGCWKARTHPLLDGDEKDVPGNLCVDVVSTRQRRRDFSKPFGALDYPEEEWPYLCPRCMDMISVADVIARIDYYYAGHALRYLDREYGTICKAIWEDVDKPEDTIVSID